MPQYKRAFSEKQTRDPSIPEIATPHPAAPLSDDEWEFVDDAEANTLARIEGKFSVRLLKYLDRHHGKFVSKRKMIHDLNGYCYGPSLVERALRSLVWCEEIEITGENPHQMIRRVLDSELRDLFGEDGQ